MEYCKITLLIPRDPEFPRPDKWDWQNVAGHPQPIDVVESEFLDSDEAAMMAPVLVGVVEGDHHG